MKNILSTFILFILSVATAWADEAILNITPRPVQATVGRGQLVLPHGFIVSYGNLPDSVAVEAARFVSVLNAATGLDAEARSTSDGLIRLQLVGGDAGLAAQPEGYSLDITAEGITVRASTTSGFFYAFQTIKKLLPANVMAGRHDATAQYVLPIASVSDAPRFHYRGFMLDVSRHFFPIEEVKRIIDLMAAYKMNVFHWHLTDDQGWRAEIKRYPKLTSVGSVSANGLVNDEKWGRHWLGHPYGPYFYTQDQMREVVAYAAQRHINVLPEVDMPGHFCAALASYPEFSCWPDGEHAVQTNQGGVYRDVMNVANPKAVQFTKDILAELMDIFPYPYIHIGGDECPTAAWEQNDACKARYAALGLTKYRQLQTLFIKEMSDFVQSRGKNLIVWNESVTAGGADLDLMAQTKATVMSWHPCQAGCLKAAQLGLKTIVTEYHSAKGGYYINRKQNPNDPYSAAGAGDDTVKGCYNYVPVPTTVPSELQPLYVGVQATFWTEHVSDPAYLQYLALPRLMAVAEAGWTPQPLKDFGSFRSRMALDRQWLDMAGYRYATHIFE